MIDPDILSIWNNSAFKIINNIDGVSLDYSCGLYPDDTRLSTRRISN